MREIWKSIPGHVGYEVSNLGRFRSYRNNGGKLVQEPRYLKTFNSHNGYKRVAVRTEAQNQRIWFAHRLVMLAFVGPSKLEVNHKNAIKHDNRLINLEYLSRSDNEKHSYRMGLKSRRGENSYVSKLTEAQAFKIKYHEHGKQKDIAKKYGVSNGQICHIKSGHSWGHI